jgi:hypothetical protein
MKDKYPIPPDFKIVSGGQTGADQAGLDWAVSHHIEHGGWCPKGRRSEDGEIDSAYPLTETPTPGYLERTEWNIRDSDASVIFTLAEELDGGSKKTAELADKLGRPWRHFHPRVHPKYLASFLNRYQVRTLNIAGKRESLAPGIGKFVRAVLDQALATKKDVGAELDE